MYSYRYECNEDHTSVSEVYYIGSLDCSINNSIFIDTNNIWNKTDNGVSFIYPKYILLQEKASQYMTRIPYVTRYRWVAKVGLKEYGNNSPSSIMLHDGDNDG